MEAHQKRVAEQKATITNLVSTANKSLVTDKGLKEVPKNPESQYPTNTVAELKALRDALYRAMARQAVRIPALQAVWSH